MFKRSKEFHRQDSDLTFGEPRTSRTVSWFITGLAICLVVGLGAFLYFANPSTDQSGDEEAILLTDPYAAVTPSAGPTLEELTGTEPAAGMPDRSVLQEPVPGVADGIPVRRRAATLPRAADQPLAILDVDGRVIGPVTEIDPDASMNQIISFALEPGLSELFNYNDSFRMPLDELAVVVNEQGDYALQLDEAQTRFLATYLMEETPNAAGAGRTAGGEPSSAVQ